MQIRTAEQDDYPALARLWNTVYPEDAHTAEAFYYADTMHGPPCRCARLVVRMGEEVVASSSYMQFVGSYHPQRFMVNVFVHPEARGQGLGARLYDDLMTRLAPLEPLRLSARVREGEAAALRFARSRGFGEVKRDWQAVLQLERFDPAPYAGLERALTAEGIIIERWPALVEAGYPEPRRALHALFSELRKDVPRSEPATPIGFEQFEKLVLNAPDFFADGLFLALAGNDLIGMTMFWKSEKETALHTGLTGVRRAYRGKGVATALKVRALAFARSLGVREVDTDNDTRNHEMIRINDKLGFVRQTAWISLRRELQKGDPS